MALKTERVDTWAATIEDRQGGLAEKLTPLAKAGLNLEFIIARRAPDRPGSGVVFITPIKGAAGSRVARQAGFSPSESLHTLRVEGPDKAGEIARITQALAESGLNLRGLSAASMNKRFTCYVALDSAADATKAARAIQRL